MTLRNVDRGRTADTLSVSMERFILKARALIGWMLPEHPDVEQDVCMDLCDEFDLFQMHMPYPEMPIPTWVRAVVRQLIEEEKSKN